MRTPTVAALLLALLMAGCASRQPVRRRESGAPPGGPRDHLGPRGRSGVLGMTTTYRASVKAWIVMSVEFGGLTLFSLWIAIAGHGRWWQAVGISGAVYLFVIFWLLRFQIAISDTEVRFRSLWSSEKCIPIHDIKRATLRSDVGNGLRGPFSLQIDPAGPSTAALLDIDAQVFHSRAIHAVVKLGRRRGATVETNDLENGVVARAVRRRPRVRRG